MGVLADLEAEVAGHPGRIGVIWTEDEKSYDLTVEDDVLLTDQAQHDGQRVALLFERVLAFADKLERHRFGNVDQTLKVFEADLRKEGAHGQC